MNKRDALMDTQVVNKTKVLLDESVLLREMLLASQMRMLDSLQADIAHQLRGPLNAMTLTAALLESSIKTNSQEFEHQAKRLRYVEIFQQELDRLNGGLDCTMSALEAISWQSCDFADLLQILQRCIDQLSARLNKNRSSCKLDAKPGRYFTQLHRPAFEIVLFNLCNCLLAKARFGDTLVFELSSQAQPGSNEAQKAMLDITLQANEDLNQQLCSAQLVTSENNNFYDFTSTGKTDLWLAQHLLQDASGRLSELVLDSLNEENKPVLQGYRFEFLLE